MIKLTVKRLFAIALFFSLIFSLDECSLWYVYVNNAVDSFDLGYSERLGEAFFADYNWDGTEQGKNIVLPEKYNGATITGLGGYTGRGYPSPFPMKQERNFVRKRHNGHMPTPLRILKIATYNI